jgi:predicted transcriptional regulator
MKTLKIGIASYKDMKARTMAIARGKLKPKPGDPKVWFTSTESFAKVLSNKNRALLATIVATHPASLQELANHTGRKTSNLSRTLKDDGTLRLRAAAPERARKDPAGSAL